MNKQIQQFFILIIFLTSSWANLSAQLIHENTVYLKNGSVIKGTITEINVDSSKIETSCHNIFFVNKSDILEIRKEDKKLSKKQKREDFALNDHKGLYSYTTIGLLTGKTEAIDSQVLSFHSVVGYSFNRYLGLGLGAGIEKLKTEIIPVFINLKSSLLKRPNSPFVNFSIGYAFPLSTSKKDENYLELKYEGGINVGFDIGILSSKAKNRAFTITAGYRYQLIKETSNSVLWYYYSIEKNTYEFNKIAIKIGFMFF